MNGNYYDVHRMCMFASNWKRERERLRRDVGFDYDMIPELVPGDSPEEQLQVAVGQ